MHYLVLDGNNIIRHPSGGNVTDVSPLDNLALVEWLQGYIEAEGPHYWVPTVKLFFDAGAGQASLRKTRRIDIVVAMPGYSADDLILNFVVKLYAGFGHARMAQVVTNDAGLRAQLAEYEAVLLRVEAFHQAITHRRPLPTLPEKPDADDLAFQEWQRWRESPAKPRRPKAAAPPPDDSPARTALAGLEPPAPAVPIIDALLAHPDPTVRRNAARSLARYPSPATANALRFALERDAVPRVRVQCAQTLGELAYKEDLALLARVAGADVPAVARAARQAQQAIKRRYGI